MKRWGLFFSLLLAMTPLYAATLAEQVHGVLAQPAVVAGRFEQVRELSGFPKPVKSRGRFLVAREHGVLWQTEAPFASSVRLSRSEILQKAGNTVTLRLSAEKEPAVRAINGVMFAMLAGDIAQLEQRFSVSGKLDGGRWTLVLVPRDSALAQVITRIELAGQRFVETVVLQDANGDRTSIRMIDVAGATALSKAEATLLE